MWHMNSAQGQGGVGEASPGLSFGSPMSQGRDEGARPKVSSPSEKSQYDSQNDSGFLSGSNLMSSSSLSQEDTRDTMLAKDSMGVGEGHISPDPKGHASLGHLDSGIEISDQLSSLHLASPTTSTSLHLTSNTSATSSGTSVTPDAFSPKKTSPQPRRSCLGLNEAQLALLQEIFQRDEDGDTQLHVAVMRGFIEVVYHITRLLPHQALLDLANHTGRTALHLAVSAGDAELARHLIVCGASPVARDRRGNTPLHAASTHGDLHMVMQLTSPVTVAEVMHARLSYAPAHTSGLLAADLPNYDGQTCIHIAAQAGHQEVLRHLMLYGADINAREGKSGRTAMHYAVEGRDHSLVTFLAKCCRASLTLETYAGLTPYQLALANGAMDLAHLLLALGAPGDELPSYLTRDEDLDYLDYDEVSNVVENCNGWDGDDLKFGGVPVTMSMPVPINDHQPFNADRYM